MYQFPAAVLLRETLAGMRPHGESVLRDVVRREQLRQQVHAVVDDLKGVGWPPERVVISVKQIAADVGLCPSPHFSRASQALANSDALLADVVRWCIERYFQQE
jgi:hypothetical protein